MNLAALKTFLAIVEAGNLVRAADNLNVTQSTVTARLNALEEELGQTLFHRRKTGAELTSAGFKFERYAQLMSDLWRQAKQETSLPDDVHTVYNIGCHGDLWSGLGEHLLEHARTSTENGAVSAWMGDQAELVRWLASGLIDVAVCYSPVLREGWSLHPLPDDELLQVATVARKLMRWDPGYIYVDHGEEFRKDHAATYADGDTPTVTFGSPVWALEYLLRNGGSAYLPRRLVSPLIADGTLFEVDGARRFSRSVYLVANGEVANTSWIDAAVDAVAR
ncbi:MAG: LysR family transcriptional regulator [Pseudomonadota bacterium]